MRARPSSSGADPNPEPPCSTSICRSSTASASSPVRPSDSSDLPYNRASSAPIARRERPMEFHITEEQRRLQEQSRCLALDFAARAARHDREASHPLENYAALRDAGFYGLNVPSERGGAGVGLFGYSLAAEELGQGCASTALAFNMHLSIVGPLMESPLVHDSVKARVARMAVHERKLIAGNFSEPATSGLVGTPVPATRARRVD